MKNELRMGETQNPCERRTPALQYAKNTGRAPTCRQSRKVFQSQLILFLALLAGAATAGLFALQDGESPRGEAVVSLGEQTVDPAEWGKLFPRQYEDYLRASERGASDKTAADKLEENPRLKILFAGHSYVADYRAGRGHSYMLSDLRDTLRAKSPYSQTGACIQCHSSNVAVYRSQGIADGAPGSSSDPLTSANGYAQLFRGFEKVSKMPFEQAAKLVSHPAACIDCHEPKTMKLRVTRPAFITAIRALAASEATAAQFQSIERWRKGNRSEPYDPNEAATRQEMRSFVCGQCHSEYYAGPEATLFYPWNNGLKADEIEYYYNSYMPAGEPLLSDWRHEDSGAYLLKAQHPEFELWSQGMHSPLGVSCADCHMPTVKEGDKEASDHRMSSPLSGKMEACQNCHETPVNEIKFRIEDIQERTDKMLRRAEDAVIVLIREIVSAKNAGLEDMQLQEAFEFHRGAQWRLDFVGSENSMGVHASGEALRLLTEALDYAVRGRTVVQNMMLKIR